MARTKQTARRSTGGRQPYPQRIPHPNMAGPPSQDSDIDFEFDEESHDSQLVPSEPTITNGTKGKVVKTTTLPVGSKAEGKDFYPVKPGTDNSSPWTEEYPTWISEAIENPETAAYAILRRYMKSNDTRKKLSLHSVVVQSPLIKKVLGEVFEGYEGITTNLERLEFKAPFKGFVHRWAKFSEIRESLKEIEGDETKKHVELLWDVLHDELKETLAMRNDLLKNGVITHELLWSIFEPGTLVSAQNGETERVQRAERHHYDCNGVFHLYTKFVEWDGTKFGMAEDVSSISGFQGTKSIVELPAFPMIYHPDAEGLQKRCIARGKVWTGYCKYQFKAYKGIGVSVRYDRYNVDSRVIIDTAAFNSLNANYAVYTNPLKGGKDYVVPAGVEVEPGDSELNSYQLLLATSKLRGYSLKDKLWLVFNLDGVKDIVWNDRAFTSLILPNDTKELVLAFAQSQIKQAHAFDDVIEGKGKGIIMLLSGPPGVGKTLTAEPVAETMRVPLYMMSAGDLGTQPQGVEKALKDILSMTTKWKAVLLLDEADVFLEARSTHDLERNKLVSIFLRTLEYFEGFLFLTSNRVDNIDGAFESRIHLSLQYESLTVESRRHVWAKFLEGMSRSDGFTSEEIDALAQIDLNGRQIKNILKTSHLLATSKDEPLSFSHVQVVTKLRAANACIPTNNF